MKTKRALIVLSICSLFLSCGTFDSILYTLFPPGQAAEASGLAAAKLNSAAIADVREISLGGRRGGPDAAGRDNVSSSNDNRQAAPDGPSKAAPDSQVKSPRLPAGQSVPGKTDAELVAEAVRQGDCAFLYEYTQKEGADKKLAAQANNAIKRYTVLDGGTGKYKTGKMDARIRQLPKELMTQVFVDPQKALPEVVSSLTKGVSDQFLKAKILHDWICDNIAYDTDMYFFGRITVQDYVSVLKKKKAVCSGYTGLMNEMCALAKIESIGISGHSKGFGYTGKIGGSADHEWNALHIGNKWYLVDVTWDAGPVEWWTFIKRYSTEWLFLDSRPFLYSHLPEDKAHQFYAPVLTADDFMREAYIAGSFFQYGLALKTGSPEYNNFVNGVMTFDIVMRKNNVLISSQLRIPNQQDQNVHAASWSERKGATVTFDFDVPDTNQYKGHVFAKYANEEKPQDKADIGVYEGSWLPGAEALFRVEDPKARKITEKELEYFKNSFYKAADNGCYYMLEDQFDTPRNNAVIKIQKLLGISTGMLENVLNFNIKAASGYQGFGNGVLKYPNTFSNYNQLSDTQLVSPKTGTLKAGSRETFVISSKNYSSFAIILNDRWNFFTKNNKTGNFELNFTVPSDADTIEISGASSRTSTHWGLVQYNVAP